MHEIQPAFAIIEFDDGVSMIRRSWASFNVKGKIDSSYYPPPKLSNDLKKLLRNEDEFTPTEDWCNDEKKPYKVKRHICNAKNYEDALNKLKMALEMSKVETDDNVNNLKLKQTRHERHKKILSSDTKSDNFDDSNNGGFNPSIPDPRKAKKRKIENVIGERKLIPYESLDTESQTDKADELLVVENNLNEPANMSDFVSSQNETLEKEDVENKIPEENEEEECHCRGGRGRKGRKKSKFEDKPEEIEQWNCSEKEIRIFKKLNTIGMMVEYLCHQLSATNVGKPEDDEEEDEEMADFPANTEDEAKLLNNKLNDKRFSKKVVSML
ncbi:uncharacterized protein LOC127278178 isoform X2 [Leptopilina boulardi]|uniref:uncharacterized protein LOC127278178 isoform X2 n=1 Tax=Leptopilina boulardi TaxID=63433 RepID=UPI0021F5A0D2|nr:uncharacterized protein LOC127278178 isoform X2 [Leptopilina boulardi]